MEEKHTISIWFFIGIELVIYGLLIFGAGIYELFVPPASPVVLYKLHSGIWWGAILLAAGIVYCLKFRPKKGI
jgi:hypothetical protein